jgi:hypothetical protein
MFYETRILDGYGNVKQTISAQELHNRHWNKFQELESSLSIYPKKNSSTPARKKRNKGLSLDHH